jgi:hypothetical protein
MPDWGGHRPGAGRKPKEPGKNRVSLSTRVSEKSSRELREYARRTGKSLGEVLDDILAFAASHPAFEAYLAELDSPEESAPAYPEPAAGLDHGALPAERTRTTVVVTKADGVAAIEVTLAGPEADPSEGAPLSGPAPLGMPLAGVPLATEDAQ